MSGLASGSSNASAAPSQDGQANSFTNKKVEEDDVSPVKRLTVTFKNITITANEAGTDYGETFLSNLNLRTWMSRFGRSSRNKKVR
jgi:hypothetical protein